MPYSHPYKPNPDQQTQGHPYAPGGNGSGSDAPNGRRFEERMDEFGRRMEEKVADLDRRVEEWSRRMDEKISGTRDTSEQGDRNTRTTATSGNSVDDFVDNILDLGTNLGTGILGTISDALNSASSAISGWRNRDRALTFPQWRDRMDRRLGSGSQSGYLAMAVLGGIFAFSFGVAALVTIVLSVVGPVTLNMAQDTFMMVPILMAAFVPITVGFGIMTGYGVKGYRFFSRIRSYLRAAHDWTCPVTALAKATGRDAGQVQRELTKAISDGKLPGVCLSPDGGTVFFQETEFLRHQKKQAGQAKQEARAAEKQAARANTSADSQSMSPEEQFQHNGREFLSYLSGCQGRLDETVDEELVQMQRTCGTILDFVRDHPEQLGRMRRFSDYYIPTTRKLLDTALDLGPVEAESARTIRRDITGILHTLNLAYVRLYDTLLQDISLDVSTEIDTLEAMLRQDGLAGGFASDFGAAAPQ